MTAEKPELRQDPAHAERGTDRRLSVALFAVGLALGGAGLLVWLEVARTWTTVLSIPWPLIVLGFLAVEATALHIELRRETHSLSLSGLPLLLGVMSLSPLGLVLARMAGSGLALVIVRQRKGLKLAWNLSLFAAEASLVAAVASFALVDGAVDRLTDLLILLAAILLAELVGLVAVPVVIMVAEGELRLSLFAQIGRSQLIAAVSSTFAVVMAAAILYLPAAGFLGLVPVIGVGFLLRFHGRLGKEHHDLRQIHRFTTVISGRDSLDSGLRELCAILRLRGAAVAVRREDGAFTTRVYADDAFGEATLFDNSQSAVDVVDGLTIVEAASSGPLRSMLDQLGGTQGLAFSIGETTEERAFILAFDRLGATQAIGEDEVRLFESMAATLGARLSADRLLDRLEAQANIDILTGLANRRTLERVLDERLSEPSRPGAVLLLDLDRFKDVNDSLGHHFGDELLRTIAARLTEEIREVDLAARLGGDEFAVIFNDLPGDEVLDARVEHLAARVGRPLDLDGITIEVGISVGLAQWPADALRSADLLRLADIAMYEAKRTHQRWVGYRTTIDHTNPDRLALMGQLRLAIEDNQLEVHFQPQHRSSDLVLTGAEALVRWNHPTLGMIQPNEFLPLAEHSSVAGELTRSVLNTALDASTRLQAAGIDIMISINLTSRDLLDRRLPGMVAEALGRKQVRPERITFEVTESSLIIDLNAAISTLAALQELGCQTSADDFGTGYASLQYLQQLPLDEVKIDQSFVARCVTNPNDEAIVRSTTHLIHDLGLRVVAEGIEDEPTLDLIRALSCDLLQGFLFSRALPLDDFIEYAAKHSAEHGAEHPHPH